MASNRPYWKTGVNTDPSAGPYFTDTQIAAQRADRKRRATPPSDDLAISRIMGAYESATDEDIESGMRWYEAAHQICQGFLESHPTVVRSVLHAAGIIAALSPQTEWKDNISRAEQLIISGDTFGVWHRVQKAAAIMNGDDPFEVLFIRGKVNWKVRAFFMNIAFPDWPTRDPRTEIPDAIAAEPAHVTVDRHAWSMLYNDRTIRDVLLRPTEKMYRWAGNLFVAAANELSDILPHQLQAITWESWRNRRSERSEEVAPRLF